MLDGSEIFHGNPYPGLRSFGPGEEGLFFGRASHVDELVRRLGETRFLAVAGGSGSGKSSLVRCGLAGALRRCRLDGVRDWRIATCRPQEDPIGHLLRALGASEVLGAAGTARGAAGAAGGTAEEAAASDVVAEEAAGASTVPIASSAALIERLRRARLPPEAGLLVIVDQFEELFRFRHNLQIEGADRSAASYVGMLLAAVRQHDLPIYVVLTLRAEYLGHCTEFPGLAEAINDGQYLVPRMTRAERRDAIVGPAMAAGAEVAPRLVDRLLDDVGDNPDQLSILQHALMRAWDEYASSAVPGEPFDLRHYEAIGTMAQALSLHAEEAWLELGDVRRQAICEILFKAITEKDPEGHGIRRPLRLGQIADLAAASEDQVCEVIEVFRRPGRSFLMPPSPAPLHAGRVIDISHESLMRIWDRLLEWVEEEARGAQTYRDLARDSARYHRGEGGLYRDPQLQLALNWRREAEPNEAWARRYDPAFERAMIFLDYSDKARQEGIARRARLRRRQIRRLQIFIAILAVSCLVALYNFMSATSARAQAEDARDLAQEERRLAVEARGQAEAARQRAVELHERTTQLNKRLVRQRRATASAQRQADDLAEQVASGGEERARLDRVTGAQALAMQSLLPSNDPQLAALLAVEAHRTLESHGEVWDGDLHDALWAAYGRLAPDESVRARHPGGVTQVALTAAGDALFTAGTGRRVAAADLTVTALAVLLGRLRHAVTALAVDAGGRRLAAGSELGDLVTWDLGVGAGKSSARQLVECRKKDDCGAVTALAWSGTLLAAGGRGGVRLWDLAAGGEPRAAAGASLAGEPRDLAWSAGGGSLASATADGLWLWPAGADVEPEQRRAGEDFRAVAFGEHPVASSDWLAAGRGDGTVVLWLPDGTQRELAAHREAVSALAFGGRLLAPGSLDRSVKVFDLDQLDAAPIVLRDHLGPVTGVALTGDGRRLASAGGETVRVVTIEVATLAGELCRRLARRQLTAEEWQEHIPGVEYRPTCPPAVKP